MNGLEFIIDKRGKHRWRYRKNGRITGESGQGYFRRSDMMESLFRFADDIHRAVANHGKEKK